MPQYLVVESDSMCTDGQLSLYETISLYWRASWISRTVSAAA